MPPALPLTSCGYCHKDMKPYSRGRSRKRASFCSAECASASHVVDMIGVSDGKRRVLGFSHTLTFQSKSGRDTHYYWHVECLNCGDVAPKSTAAINQKHGCRNCAGQPKGQAGLDRMYVIYKKQAAKHSRSFRLSRKQFARLTSEDCTYCGKEPEYTSGRGRNKPSRKWGHYRFNGIDRVVNSRGYVDGHCVPCCIQCNRAKHSYSLEAWQAHIARLVNHNTPVRQPSWNECREAMFAEYQPTERQLLSV